jgi:hypothetical protein
MAQFTSGSEHSLGMDIMRRINEGELKKAPSEYIEAVKAKIILNCEELIMQGARVRPLMSDGKQVGWCRGVHVSERQMLKHWIKDPNDYILNVLLLGTSYTTLEIEEMSAFEVRSLTEVVQQMTAYDASLMPYLQAYSTSAASENLWFSKGAELAAWENRIIDMPDGKKIRLMLPSEHARIWVSLCSYRNQAKKRLEQDFNALFIVRPWAGRSADPIQAELNRVARTLDTNAQEPWEQVVRPVRPDINKNDGWGHPGDSLEDLQRELKGMMSGDKHEQLMDKWQKQMEQEAEDERKARDEKRKLKGTDEAGVVQQRTVILTEKEIRERQKAMQSGKAYQPKGVVRREDTEVEPTDRQLDKVRRYK